MQTLCLCVYINRRTSLRACTDYTNYDICLIGSRILQSLTGSCIFRFEGFALKEIIKMEGIEVERARER